MDIYDGADWTEMDIDDLKAAIESDRSIEEAAEFLCRAGSVDDVARGWRLLSSGRPEEAALICLLRVFSVFGVQVQSGCS
jgi:hypothetical protein